MKNWLVPDWRDAWRWFSVRAMALSGAAGAAWLAVPDDLRAAVPEEYLGIGALVLSVLGIIGRLVDQSSAEP